MNINGNFYAQQQEQHIPEPSSTRSFHLSRGPPTMHEKSPLRSAMSNRNANQQQCAQYATMAKQMHHFGNSSGTHSMGGMETMVSRNNKNGSAAYGSMTPINESMGFFEAGQDDDPSGSSVQRDCSGAFYPDTIHQMHSMRHPYPNIDVRYHDTMQGTQQRSQYPQMAPQDLQQYPQMAPQDLQQYPQMAPQDLQQYPQMAPEDLQQYSEMAPQNPNNFQQAPDADWERQQVYERWQQEQMHNQHMQRAQDLRSFPVPTRNNQCKKRKRDKGGFISYICPEKPPADLKGLCNVYDYCDGDYQSPGKCINAISDLTCNDLETAINMASQEHGEEIVEDMCEGLNKLVDYTQENVEQLGQDLEKTMEWYSNTFAPCAQKVCAKTKFPVSSEKLVNIPRNIVKIACSKAEEKNMFIKIAPWLIGGLGFLVLLLTTVLFLNRGKEYCDTSVYS